MFIRKCILGHYRMVLWQVNRMVVKFSVNGTKDARLLLSKSEKNIKSGVKTAMSQVSLFMEGEVKKSIAGQKAEPKSVDTGQFLNSIKSSSTAVTATISSNVEQAKYLEFGTSQITQRRHFRNSLSRNRTKIKDFLEANARP